MRVGGPRPAQLFGTHGQLGLLDNAELIVLALVLHAVDELQAVHVEEEDQDVDQGDEIVAAARTHEVEGVLACEQHRTFELIFDAVSNVLPIVICVPGDEAKVDQAQLVEIHLLHVLDLGSLAVNLSY